MHKTREAAKKRRVKSPENHLDVLELSVYLQQLGLAPPLLPLLFSRRLSSLRRPVSVASLLAAGCAQSSHPLAHIDS